MTDFSKYTCAVFQAFKSCTAPDDVIAKKVSIIDQVCKEQMLAPKTILFVGFNPAIYDMANMAVFVTDINDEVHTDLDANSVAYQYISRHAWAKHAKQFDCVVAAEEYLTFANSDQSQHDLVQELAALTKHCLITTVRDYKNLEYKEREFSLPAVIKAADQHILFFEYHNHDLQNRGVWKSTVHKICGQQLTCFGPFDRRTMYFKQLAKFSADAGSQSFTVHKNLMYKSLIKKNYEHVISIKF